MNPALVIRLCLVGLGILLVWAGWNEVKDDPGMMLIYFIFVGAAGGFLVVKFMLPWFGDAVTTALLSSGEEVRSVEGMKAAAKMAQGDYEGAIAEHEKTLAERPDQPFPVAEIAKICVEKLRDTARALAVLNKHLDGRTWPEDDAAFLRFRIIEIHADHLQEYEVARELLQQVIADFPNTRHSANAHHRLHEVEQAQYKQITAHTAARP